MKHAIFKKMHYALPLQVRMPRTLNTTNGTVSVRMDVLFYPSAAYNLGDEDQYDWNKLGGLVLGVDGIHKNSFRFGWRYNATTHMIEIAEYEYIDGSRIMCHVGDVAIGERVSLGIELTAKCGEISVNYLRNGGIICVCPFTRLESLRHRKVLAFFSGLYFGGNKTAPHRIVVGCKTRITKGRGQ